MTKPESFPLTWRTALLALAGYFLLQLILRTLVSGSVQLDEAEQLLMTQEWRRGYGSQPPLYSWLQKIVFTVFGPNVFSLALLKNTLLLGVFIFTGLSAREIFRENRAALLVVASLFLMPGLSWESQRDQTHLVLATLMAAATLFTVLRLMETRCRRAYLGLGVLAGLGLLTKYNFAFFLLALAGAAISLPQFRSVLLDRKILLTVAGLLLVTAPHFHWAWTHAALTTSQSHKFHMAAAGWSWAAASQGGLAWLRAVAEYTGTLGLIYFLLCFRAPRPTVANDPARERVRLLWRAVIIGVALCLGTVLAFQVTIVKARWLQPLLFVHPILLVAWARSRLSPRRQRLLLAGTALVMVLIPLVLYGSVAGARFTRRPTNWNAPYPAMCAQMRAAGFERGVVLAERTIDGGNLKLAFPESTVLVPDLDQFSIPTNAPVLIVWNPGRDGTGSAAFWEFALRRCGVAASQLAPQSATAPVQYFPARQQTLRFAILPGGRR